MQVDFKHADTTTLVYFNQFTSIVASSQIEYIGRTDQTQHQARTFKLYIGFALVKSTPRSYNYDVNKKQHTFLGINYVDYFEELIGDEEKKE